MNKCPYYGQTRNPQHFQKIRSKNKICVKCYDNLQWYNSVCFCVSKSVTCSYITLSCKWSSVNVGFFTLYLFWNDTLYHVHEYDRNRNKIPGVINKVFSYLFKITMRTNQVVDIQQICPPIFWAFSWKWLYFFLSIQLNMPFQYMSICQ